MRQLWLNANPRTALANQDISLLIYCALNMKLKTVPIFLAFLAMGFADAVGPFVSLAKNEFQLSNAVAALIPFVGFSMFGLLSIPVGVFQDKRGKKFVLMLGLIVVLAGLVNASFGLHSFERFLLTVMLVGAGAAILQVAGNPIMRDVSDEGKYSRNLTLGQFAKAIGSLSGPMIPVIAAKYFGADWKVMFPIYTAALLVTVLSVSLLRVKEKARTQKAATVGSCLALLKNGYVLAMVAAIFFYVGAEVSVSAGIPLFLKERYDIDIGSVGLLGTGLFFTALTIGRFSGGVILNWMAPRKFFLTTCVVSLVGLAGLFLPDRNAAVASFFIAGLGFANIFPLVFSIAVENMPEHTNELSGLMVTAIVGGAILPPLMGLVADYSSVQFSFLVPVAALLYIAWTALINIRSAEARRYAELLH
jgi:fucose permease